MQEFFKFWGESLWASFSFGWAVFGIVSTAMPALFALLVRFWPGVANVAWVKWASDHQSELHVGIALIFIGVYFFYAPYKLYNVEHSARLVAERKVKSPPEPTPLKLDVADLDAREELKQTKQRLASAYATIRELDPLRQPIASVRITGNISMPTDKRAASDYIGGGVIVFLVRGATSMLAGHVGEQHVDGKGNIRFAIQCDPDDPDNTYMGKPIEKLAEAEYIQVAFKQTDVPINSQVAGGKITFVVNNQITLSFSVPAQTLNTQAKFGDMGTLMFVRDLKPGFSTFIKRLSERNPDREGSPH